MLIFIGTDTNSYPEREPVYFVCPITFEENDSIP